MEVITPRPASVDEVAVVRNALSRAPNGSRVAVGGGIEALRVVGVCDCGCASVYFTEIRSDDEPVADGIGTTPSGKEVGVMVWARDGEVTALDIVDHHGSGELPIPGSIRGYGERDAL